MRSHSELWDFIPDPLTRMQPHPSPTCPIQPPFAAALTSVPCLLSGISILRDHPGTQQQQQKQLWQHSFDPVFWAKVPPKSSRKGEAVSWGSRQGAGSLSLLSWEQQAQHPLGAPLPYSSGR